MKILDSRSLALLAAPLLLGVRPASARGRHVVLRPALVPPVSRPVPFGAAVKRFSNAQLLPETSARSVELQGDSLSIKLGDVVLLPFSGVTRIITEDDEIARAYFQNGSPVLQGVAVGVTNVEIYQASNSPRVLTITVASKAAPALPFPAGTPVPTVTPEPLPAPTSTPEPLPVPTATPESIPLPAPPGGMGATPPDDGVPTGMKPGDPLPPSTTLEPPTTPDPSTATQISPAHSSLSVALRAAPTNGNAAQTTFYVAYQNPGTVPARGVVVRFALDSRVSYVTDSASNGGQYDPSQREVRWNIGDLPAGFTGGQLSLRVEPIERSAFSFRFASDHSGRFERHARRFGAGALFDHDHAASHGFCAPRPLFGGRQRAALARCQRRANRKPPSPACNLWAS